MAVSLMLAAPLLLGATAHEPAGQVEARLEGLRSTKGMILACLSRDRAYFLKCDRDPAAYRAKVPADAKAVLRFTGVTPGEYSLAVVHDENQNSRLDKMLGIPREGVGFSRNPTMIMGPPRYEAVRFHIGNKPVSQVIKLRYFL